MSGISSTLSIAKTAIATQQYGLNITGQNIANVNNPDYSVQTADHKNRQSALYSGFLFGTGVDMFQIRQSVDQLIEDRLTNELSSQASFEEQESYMRILESYFDESAETSISNTLTQFWNSWHDLSDNPKGSAERVAVLEYAETLVNTFESTATAMDQLSQDITSDISASVVEINMLSSQIADLNGEIMSSENGRTANDARDQRNRLIDELGNLIDIDTFEDGSSVVVNIANAFTIVNEIDTNQLSLSEEQIVWTGSSGVQTDVTSKITSGKIGGLLEMRDEILPKYRTEIDELTREMIWAVNYQASQGAGLEYFSEPVIGEYAVDDSGWFTGFEFGDKIDFSKEFVMWMEDKTTADTQYTKLAMDMNISQADISNWQGGTPGSAQSKYQLTVVEGGILGDKIVTESDGDGLAVIQGDTTDVSGALNSAIAEQTLSIYDGPQGTQVIDIKDIGVGAKRSAASIAEALNQVEGVNAFASENSVGFDTSDILNAQDGDEIQFSLYVDGIIQPQSFIRDSTSGTLKEQFEDALLIVAEAVNSINEDDDLFVEGLSITSQAGRTLGVQDFEVLDNAGVSLNNFMNFDDGDSVTFTIDSMVGTSAASTTNVSVDFTNIDASDQAQIAEAFSSALTSALNGKSFSVYNDLNTNSVVIRTTDGSDIRLRDAGNDNGNNATIELSELSGTTADGGNGNTTLDFLSTADDTARYNAETTSDDDLIFSGGGNQLIINESTAGSSVKAGVMTGTVTATMNPGMSIFSTVSGSGTGGLFDSQFAKTGSSILTLGGENGFSNFTSSTAANETISFDLDGTNISFLTSAAGGTSDIQLATLLEAEIIADLGGNTDYQIIRTGSSVSIIKDSSLDDPIEIENFTDSSGSNATIQVRTGTGTGSNQPEKDLLDAGNLLRNSTTSTLYDDNATILWERFDEDGFRTGASGLLTVEDEGQVTIMESGLQTLSFDISEGSLVAGNTLTVNTDTSGNPDPLNFTIAGRAGSINEIYKFKVVSGGKVGHVPTGNDEPLVIEWSSSVKTGTFTIEGHDPPYTPLAPVEVKVDGMILKFSDGTLFSDDVFTITTGDTGIPTSLDSAGKPTGEKMADWHWTTDSFVDQFNRQAPGLKASMTLDNQLEFEASDIYYAIENIQYSEENGFNEVNTQIQINDWKVMDFAASDLRFIRSGGGGWGVMNDPTGGVIQLLPEGGDDDGFGVDFTGDGLADMEIKFTERVSGDGFVEFDFQKRSANDIGFAFSDNASSSSGLIAAAGINTFFKGYDAQTIEMSDGLDEIKFVTSAKINSETGQISEGDNTNALAMADLQYQSLTLRSWTYERGSEAQSNKIDATLDDFYNQMVSILGIESRGIKDSKEFADIMVNNITVQRDSISAVSLDEEMIRLIKYQHAFSAASKLLTVSDEMLNTLIAMR